MTEKTPPAVKRDLAKEQADLRAWEERCARARGQTLEQRVAELERRLAAMEAQR